MSKVNQYSWTNYYKLKMLLSILLVKIGKKMIKTKFIGCAYVVGAKERNFGRKFGVLFRDNWDPGISFKFGVLANDTWCNRISNITTNQLFCQFYLKFYISKTLRNSRNFKFAPLIGTTRIKQKQTKNSVTHFFKLLEVYLTVVGRIWTAK